MDQLARASRAAGAVLGLATVAVSMDTAADAVGRTEADYGVTPNGAASYTVPIRVTEGINGLTPQLAVSYVGPGTRTILGVGFGLSGISYITPCRKTIAQDLGAAPVTLTSADRYCLDGARLRAVSGTYGADGTIYRTELEQMVRVTSWGASNGIPGWFRVQMPNGMEYEYGNSASSKLLASGATGAPPQFWAVSKILDPDGNAIVFDYDTDHTAQRFRPLEIRYTVRGSSSNYKLAFLYDTTALPSPFKFFTPSNSGAAAHQTDKLLQRIELWHDSTLYRQMEFTYEGGAGNNRRLKTVRECAMTPSQDCLPATTFTWQSATAGHDAATTSYAVGSTVRIMDVNGDGFEDLVWPESTWRYRLGGSSGYGAVIDTGVTVTNANKAMPLDWNGDGRWDLLIDWSDGKWRVLTGTANGLSTSAVQAGSGTGLSSNTTGKSLAVIDMNGDGRDDLVQITLDWYLTIDVSYNSASGLGGWSQVYYDESLRTSTQGLIQAGASSAIRRPDFNGDGRTDLLVYACLWDEENSRCMIAHRWMFFISQGTSYVNQGSPPYATYMIEMRYGDFNGDGLTDLVYPAQTPGKWYIGYGRGNGLSIVAGPSFSGYTNYRTLVGDYDGDGYDDLYAATSSSPQWHVFHGSAQGLTTSAIATNIAATSGGWALVDQNGDSLPDLAHVSTSPFQWSVLPHKGLPGERLLSATDGLGNVVSFGYLPMTDSAVYTKGSAAIFPDQDYQSGAPLVGTMTVSPAGASTSTLAYKYTQAKVHAQGRAFLGMGTREITDSRNGLFTVEAYRQDFPYIGAPATSTIKQSASGSVIQNIAHTYSNHVLDATSGNQRYLPYRSQSVTSAYEVGGAKNGNLISEITETHTVNTYGNSTFIAIDARDKDTGSPEFNSNYRTEITSAYVQNETYWCIGLPLTRSEKRILPGGVNETRAVAWDPDAPNCRITKETLQPGGGSLLSLVTDIGYDTCGNVNSSSSYPAGTSGQQRTTTINYGTRCQRPESITNAENETSTFLYDWPLAQPSRHTDPNGVHTDFTYDGFGRLARRDHPDGTDLLVTLSACNAGNSWCGKDSTVRVRATQSLRNSTDGLIRKHEQFLDGFGRPRWLHSDSLESGPTIVRTDYDAFGRPNAQSQPYFGTGPIFLTIYTRDLIGRVTQINAPISEGQTSGRITGLAYEGRDLKVTNPRGFTTTRRSNVVGQLRAVIDPSPGGTTSYAYHPFGEINSITDAASNVTSWSYNLRGFMTGTTDPDAGSWTYEANAFGETTKIRDAKTVNPAWTTEFTFDKLGRPKTRLDVPESLTTTWNWGTSAANKNIGRLESITMSAGGYSESYSYDSLARLSQQTVTADGTTYYLNLTYVPATGLLNTLEYPTSTSGYRLKLAHEYANGLLKRVKDANGTTVFWEAVNTDPFGRVQDELFGNGVRTFTSFDRASGLMQYREGGIGGGSGLIHSQVDWDLNGNLKQRKDLKLAPTVTEDFYYDALDRFDYSQRTPAGGATSTNADVTLDAIGNISWKLGVGNYSYHATKRRAVISAGSNSYGYDANGNMNVRNGAGIGYTSYNLPNVINAPGGYSSTISYGAFRNRFKQVAVGPQGTETTIYVAGLLEKVSNGSGTHYRHYIRGGNGTAAIHSRTVGGANTTVYLHRDHLGSPELITDASGNELVRPSFSAYGERRDGADWDGPIGAGDLATLAGISRRGFTGHEHLDAVGLIHMNGRVFEPVAGRFLSVDPYIDGWASSQGPNGFAYAHNNPLSLIDPSGFLTATRYADVERRCQVICFSVGQKFPFLDLFGEPDWDDRWRTIPNPFVQVEPQQQPQPPQSPQSPHETWDGHFASGTRPIYGVPSSADNQAKDDDSYTLRNDFIDFYEHDNGMLYSDRIDVTYAAEIGEDVARAYFERIKSDYGRAGIHLDFHIVKATDFPLELQGEIEVHLAPCRRPYCDAEWGSAQRGGRTMYYVPTQRPDTPSHEFGHILGRGHPHSTDDPRSIMGPSRDRKVQPSDVERIRNCYILNACGP